MTARVVLHDASILIDIHKVGLLEKLSHLPYELWVNDVVWHNELLSIPDEVKKRAEPHFRVCSLSGEQVDFSSGLVAARPALSLVDCYALSLAKDHPGCILLCSDRLMRSTAQELNIDVHGVFWLFDQFASHGICDRAELCGALQRLEADPTTRLPRALLREQIRRYQP